MKEVLRAELETLRSQGLYRTRRVMSSAQGREVVIDGKTVLNFCSNDYLGLAADARLVSAAGESLGRSGFGSGASRLICGDFETHRLLEAELARWKGTEAALVFSCGYMANTGTISALADRETVVFSDRLNHASIVDGIILSRAELRRYPHNDVAALEGMLSSTGEDRRKLVVTDTVFSMDGDVAPLRELVALCRKYGAWLMVDEAHAFGVMGPTGAGLAEALGVAGDVDVQMGTLSKAAGSFGAYVAGSKELVDHLVNRARSFVYTTAIPPSVAAAGLAALGVMRAEPERRQRVLSLATKLRQGLAGLGCDTLNSTTPIIPVMVKDAERAVRLSGKLFELGILAQAIRPPTVPSGSARLRVTVTAAHTEEDLVRCLEAFREALSRC
ncbi:MAG: 8-amino-7-oxononanoate synthase [Candidatus Omnitrophica bacterium]|nr:8-amino-7-oxononanoate synthase [Candidatus Omnitrophota bacterium]